MVGSQDRLVLPEGAAPGTAARWRQAARLLRDMWVQGWELGVSGIPGDSRTSPPQGWWTREPPFSGLSGVSLQSTDPSPGVRGPASVVPIWLRVIGGQPGDWVWPSRPGRTSAPSSFWCCWGGRGREGPQLSGHHAKAPGNPPPEVATAAAEGHLRRLLEDGVDVFLEQS